MHYEKFIIHHSRGKSDTNFYQEKTILNGAHSSIIYIRSSLFKDIETKDLNNLNKNKKRNFTRKYSQDSISINTTKHSSTNCTITSNNDNYNLNINPTEDNDILLSLLEKILLFKKEVDSYFFRDKLQYLKFHLNNIAAIIMKHIEELQNQLITQCPQIKEDGNDNIINLLNNFIDILKLFIETKPQDFYREVKDAIINQWEKNNQEILDYFHSLEENSIDNENSDLDYKIVGNFLLENKTEIKKFLYRMSQGTLFAISQMFFKMDYYSLTISSMVFKIFYGIMAYIDINKVQKNRDMSVLENSRQSKVLHIVCHIISLAGIFSKNNQDFNNIDNGGLNSMSKYILNNLNELIPKCKGIKDPENEVVIKNSLFKKMYNAKFYKCYLQRYKKYTDNHLLKLFDLFYNSKFIFWKSTIFELEDKKQTNFCCRICEKKIPLNEIILHMYYCNEQKQFYEKINQIKIRCKYCINLLEYYINELIIEMSSNINNADNNARKHSLNSIKGKCFSEVVKFLPKNDENDGNDVINFMKDLLRIFRFENDKPLNYYEDEPQKLTHIIYISYLCIFLYTYNKSYQFSEVDLNEIFGGLFNCSLQVMMNVLFLLYIKKTKAKSNFMNQINNNVIQENIMNKEDKKLPIKQIDLDNDLAVVNFGKSDSYESSEKSKSNSKNLNQLVNDFKIKLSLNKLLNINNTDKVNSIYNNSNYYNMSTKSNTNISSFYNNYNGETDNGTSSLKLRKFTNLSAISSNSSLSNKSRKFRKYRSKTVILINSDDKILIYKVKDDNLQYAFNSNIKAARKNYDNETNNNEIIFNNEILNYTTYNNNLNNLINDQEKEKTDGCSIILNESSNTLLITESEYGDEMGSFFGETDVNGNSIINNGLKNNLAKRTNFKKRHSTKTGKLKSFRLKRKTGHNKLSLFTSNNNQNFENDGDNILIDFEEEEDDDGVIDEIIDDKLETHSDNENDSLENYANEFSDLNFNLDPEMIKFIFDRKFSIVFEELLKNITSENDKNNETEKINNNRNFIKRFNSTKKLGNFSMLVNGKGNIDKIKNINEHLLQKKNNDTNNTNNTISEKENEDSFSISSNIKDNNFRSSGSYKKAQKIANNILEKEKNKQKNDSEKMSGFKFIFPIAKGGYGSVALYQKIATGDYYAIKAVDINCMKERKLSSTLKKEHAILAEMNSDYVVKSYFIFPGEKYYYYVMEYLPGGDVGDLLSKIVLKTTTIQLIVAEMLLGILYLHQVGIIHHDIKPENILISKEGHFKLSDFGLSKTLKKSSKKNVRKLQDFVDFNENSMEIDSEEDKNDDRALGTLDYMSPELFTDEYPVGASIDYWATGVVIFELFTNKVPFQGQTQDETKNNIIEMKIDWEPLLNDETKKNYKDIDIAIDLIKKFLVRDPSKRWGDENFNEIKQHPFFKDFNWNKIKQIRDPQVMFCIKKLVQANNEKIKKLNMKKKLDKNGSSEDKNIKDTNENNNGDFPLLLDINLTENEEKVKFTERLDNLNKKNNELIQRKFIKREFNIKDNKDRISLLMDLE